jgi:hypothetical protein
MGKRGGGKKKESDEDAATKTSSTTASNAMAVPPLRFLLISNVFKKSTGENSKRGETAVDP